jgi:hypothetical protein
MTHSEAKHIIDQCEQKHPMSCAPSAIEMVLKLHSLVPLEFTELQDMYQNQNVGFEPFAGGTLHGVAFQEHSDREPFLNLLCDVTRETHQGRAVIISTKEPCGGFHIWIATEVCYTDIRALSKHGRATVEILLLRDRLGRWPHGHYLTYKIVEGANDQQLTNSDAVHKGGVHT